MTRIVTVGAAQLGPIARSESRAQVVARMIELMRQAKAHGCDLDLTLSYKNTTFNFAKHREPQAYGLIVERKGAVPPPLE